MQDVVPDCNTRVAHTFRDHVESRNSDGTAHVGNHQCRVNARLASGKPRRHCVDQGLPLPQHFQVHSPWPYYPGRRRSHVNDPTAGHWQPATLNCSPRRQRRLQQQAPLSLCCPRVTDLWEHRQRRPTMSRCCPKAPERALMGFKSATRSSTHWLAQQKKMPLRLPQISSSSSPIILAGLQRLSTQRMASLSRCTISITSFPGSRSSSLPGQSNCANSPSCCYFQLGQQLTSECISQSIQPDDFRAEWVNDGDHNLLRGLLS